MNQKPPSKWQSIGQRLAQCKDGEYIVVEPEGDVDQEARKLRCRLDRIAVCRLIRRSVKIVDGKIIVTRLGLLPVLVVFGAPGLSAAQAGVLRGHRGVHGWQSARR
ncbi:MAG: hypothetical protein DMG32_21565 [Acidobacteria bacterium]|nr:MAG: hypothetical protein DMG32_21565 [Acidobacteriota bacterium]